VSILKVAKNVENVHLTPSPVPRGNTAK